MLSALLSSCSILPGTHRAEPRYIVVRNNSGRDLRNISVMEARNNPWQAIRLASVSTLPKGQEYSVLRRTNASPLPAHGQVQFEWEEGVVRSVPISIKELLRAATGAPNEALVVQVYPDADVGVSIEMLKKP